MKFKKEIENKNKKFTHFPRGSKNNLTKGAFGKGKIDKLRTHDMRVLPRYKQREQNKILEDMGATIV